MNNHRDTFKELRDLNIFSGSDSFMQGGHQIINSNRAGAGGKRKNSDWARSDKKVQELLFFVFPKLKENNEQRNRASRWARVIQLHYRLGLSYGDTAAEMGVKTSVVKSITQRMRRALKGQPCNGINKRRKCYFLGIL